MPIERKRYPKNWNQIAASAKQAVGWRCQHCQQLCLRPGEKPSALSRSERTKLTRDQIQPSVQLRSYTTLSLDGGCLPLSQPYAQRQC